MHTSYTSQMESTLFNQWGGFDDYTEDYSSLIETINSETTFNGKKESNYIALKKWESDLKFVLKL